MKVKAVVFDLDGTIASFNIDYIAVRSEVHNFLIAHGLPLSIMAANESIFEMLKKAEAYLNNSGNPERIFNHVREKALAIAEKYELEAAKKTSLLPGVAPALKKMKKMGLRIGLCTVNSDKATSHILERFKIAEYFDAVVTRNAVRYVKPNIEHLKATLKALSVTPEDAVLVGDGTRDMQCASDLKVIAIGLATGASTINELKAHGANYVVTSVANVPTLVENINETDKSARAKSSVLD